MINTSSQGHKDSPGPSTTAILHDDSPGAIDPLIVGESTVTVPAVKDVAAIFDMLQVGTDLVADKASVFVSVAEHGPHMDALA